MHEEKQIVENDTEENKEEFCAACIAAPLAAIGVGVGAGSHKKKKSVMLWVGLSITIISILVAIYYLWIKKCDECR